jgi:hypothetical protein
LGRGGGLDEGVMSDATSAVAIAVRVSARVSAQSALAAQLGGIHRGHRVPNCRIAMRALMRPCTFRSTSQARDVDIPKCAPMSVKLAPFVRATQI